MNKNLLTEISRMKEIMGLSLLNEQRGLLPEVERALEYLGVGVKGLEKRALEELVRDFDRMSLTARNSIEEMGRAILAKDEALIAKQLEKTLSNPSVEKELVSLIFSKTEDGGAKLADEIMKAKFSPERYEQLSILFQDPKYKQKALKVLEDEGVMTPENELVFKNFKPRPIEANMDKTIDNYFDKIGLKKDLVDMVIAEGGVSKQEIYNFTKKYQAEFEKLPKEEQKQFADSVMNELERLAKKESVGSAAFYPGSGSGSGTPKPPPPPGTEGFQKVLYYVKNTPSLLIYGGFSIALIYIMVVLLGNLKCIRHKSIGEVLLQCVLGVDDDDEDENNSDDKDNNKKKKKDEVSDDGAGGSIKFDKDGNIVPN